MRILDNLKINEKILLEQNQTTESEFYLTNYRFILHDNSKPDYSKLYFKEIEQCGEIFEGYILLELKYLTLILLDDYRYGPVAYLYFKKDVVDKDIDKIKRRKSKKRIKIKTDIEIGIGFESYDIQNLFLTNIIKLKPDVVIGGFPRY
ncbi:MAG: hypothetical protein ACFFC1_14340 [Promethearchaeota archaeon]